MATPASAGPTTRPILNWADDSETAAPSSAVGTRSGIMAWKAGKPMAAMAPPPSTRSVTTAGRGWPAQASAARTAANAVSPQVVANSHERRSRRSAITPPTGDSKPMGRKPAAATRPVQPGWPVRAVTRIPTATVCIQVPTLDRRAAVQINAKLRWRSGAREVGTTDPAYGAGGLRPLDATSQMMRASTWAR